MYYRHLYTDLEFFYEIKLISKEHWDLSSVSQSHSGEIVTPILRPLCLFRKHSWHTPRKTEFTSKAIMQSKVSAITVNVSAANEMKISILRTRCYR